MEQVPEALARWATSDGLPWVAEATALLDAGQDDLAVVARLRGVLPAPRAAFTASAAQARRRARAAGVEGADALVLTREGLEQASHPAVAAWRAARLAATGHPLQDWCAGTGADAVALAAHGPVVAVERDPGRAVLARHRAAVLGRDVRVVVGDVLAPAVSPAGALVHADPDRRDATGRRAVALADHGPPVDALHAAARGAAGTAVVVAPGLAWDDPSLPADAEVAFASVDGVLAEATLLRGAARSGGARARAVLLPEGLERTRVGPPAAVEVGAVAAWLVRPAVAAVRARCHDDLARELDAHRLARTRALLTTARRPAASPWWRSEAVLGVVPARARAVRDLLRAHPDREVELVLHGVQVDPGTFLRGAGRPPTGPHDLRVHLVRRDEDAVAVLTTVRVADHGDEVV